MPCNVSARSLDGGSATDVGAFPWRLLPVMIIAAFVVIGLDRLDGVLLVGDIDDTLRGLQIHQLLTSGHWHDLSLPMIRMPDAYVSPWSRLVDAPYVAITWVLSFFLDPEQAMRWSFQIWPPVMLVGYCTLSFTVLRGLSTRRLGTDAYIVVAMTLFMVFAVCEFTPGRIDHHNVQILLLLTMLAGVMRWTVSGGIITGVATALSVAVGLECLPIIAVLLGCIVAAWLLDAEGSGRMLRSTMLATSISTPLVGLVLIGPAGVLSTQCDAFSAPYVYAASALSLMAWVVAFYVSDNAPGWKKLLWLVLPCAVISLGFALLFPRCMGGPYGIIDPISRQFWFSRIQQEGNILGFLREGQPGPFLIVMAQVLTAVLALPTVLRQMRRDRPQEAIVYAMALSTLLFTVFLTRFIRFPAAFIPLFLPVVIARLVSVLNDPSTRRAGIRAFVLAVVPVAVVTLAAVLLVPARVTAFDAIDFMNIHDCREGDFSGLAALPAGKIVAPPGLGLAIATRAPPGLSVSAIPYHRSSPGLRRTFIAFTTADAGERREALAPFDYVAVCRVPVPLDRGVAPLYTALAAGGSWPGLVPVGTDDGTRPLRLFRIDHQDLR